MLRNGAPFLAIVLKVTLTGPSPWRVAGSATFTCFGQHTIPFAVIVGTASADPPPAKVALLPLITAALAKPGNCQLQPPTQHSLVVLSAAATAAQGQLLHPFATVSVRQRIAPLGLDLTQYGSSPLADGPQYTITAASLGDLTGTPLTDEFAVGQYLQLSAAQQLSMPSFQSFSAGVSFDGAALTTDTSSAQTVATTLATYTIPVASSAVAGSSRALAAESTSIVDDTVVLRQLATAASARDSAGSRGATAYSGPPSGPGTVNPTYAVASRVTLAPLLDDAGNPLIFLPSRAGAEQIRQQVTVSPAQIVETTDSVAAPLPALVPGLDPAAYYTLTATHSGCRLEAGQDRLGGVYQLRQGLPRDDGTQFWRLLPLGDGSYVITVDSPGAAIGAAGTVNGTPVSLSYSSAGIATGWRLTPVGTATYRIDLIAAGRCLDVVGGPAATAPGAPLQLWDWWGGTNQTWRLEAVSAGSVLRQRIREVAFTRWLNRGAPLWSALEDWGPARDQVVADAIRADAWWHFARRGGGPGHALDDWLAAEREIIAALESS